MNCTKCGVAAPAGAKACPKCGRAFASTSGLGDGYSYDLMPDETPAVKTSGPASGAPVGPLPPASKMPGGPGPGVEKSALDSAPAAGPRESRGAASNAASGGLNLKLLAGVGVVVLLIVYFMFLMPSRPELKFEGTWDKKPVTVTVSAEKAKLYFFSVSGKGQIEYSMEVAPIDGDLLVGVAKRKKNDPSTNADLKKFGLTVVKAGATGPLSGEVESGGYSLILVNDSKKPVKVKVTNKSK